MTNAAPGPLDRSRPAGRLTGGPGRPATCSFSVRRWKPCLYPPPGEASPLDGDLAPPGHRLDDAMWPWVGAAAGFDLDIEPAVRALLPDFSTSPTRTVKQVLDTETIDPTGYRYAPPSSS